MTATIQHGIANELDRQVLDTRVETMQKMKQEAYSKTPRREGSIGAQWAHQECSFRSCSRLGAGKRDACRLESAHAVLHFRTRCRYRLSARVSENRMRKKQQCKQ